MHQVAISTASFCLWDVEPQDKLVMCKEFGRQRIEVAFSTVKMLREFVSLPHLLEKLTAFKHITMHIPWCGVNYGDNSLSRKIMDYLHEINEKIAVEAFVVHFDTVTDFAWLNQKGLPFYLENALGHGSLQLFQKVVEDYNFNCVLDINRATRYNDYLDRFVDEHIDNIKEIHVSGFADKMGRMPIRESNQEYLLDRVKQLNVPFVIEGLFSPGDFDSIHKEIELVYNKTCCN